MDNCDVVIQHFVLDKTLENRCTECQCLHCHAVFLRPGNLKNVTHVLFDLDGLLLDTEGIYKQIITDIAAEHGKVYSPEVRAKLLGRTEKDCCKIAVDEMQLPVTYDKFQHEFRTRSNALLHQCPLLPGAEKYVRHLYSNKIPIAIATSSSEDSFRLKTAVHGEFFKMFDHFVTGGSDPEVRSGKPNPDIFLVCAKRFRRSPTDVAHCLVMEDAPNGITAAISAGMQCVAVPDSSTPHVKCGHATLVLSSLEELDPVVFGLPPYNAGGAS